MFICIISTKNCCNTSSWQLFEKSHCNVPPASLHNVPVPFLYGQLEEPDARVRKIIPLWQGISVSLANSKDRCVNQPLWSWFWLYNEVVHELALRACSPGTLCLQLTFECRKLVALPKRHSFLKASQLIYAVLVSQLNLLLASDLAPEDRREIFPSRSYSWAQRCSPGLSSHLSDHGPILDIFVVCNEMQGSLELTYKSLVLWWYQRWSVQAPLRWCRLWGRVGFFRTQTRRILWILLWECIYLYRRANSDMRCKCSEESSLWLVLLFWLGKNRPHVFYQMHWNYYIKLNHFLLFILT